MGWWAGRGCAGAAACRCYGSIPLTSAPASFCKRYLNVNLGTLGEGVVPAESKRGHSANWAMAEAVLTWSPWQCAAQQPASVPATWQQNCFGAQPSDQAAKQATTTTTRQTTNTQGSSIPRTIGSVVHAHAPLKLQGRVGCTGDALHALDAHASAPGHPARPSRQVWRRCIGGCVGWRRRLCACDMQLGCRQHQ